MKETKVSIITVCLNSVKTLEHTIQSVINQTYKNIEYIIVDGVSTDGTLDIISKYADYITKWVSEKDQGLYDAMNKGIDMATGDIIGIINSDDWYELNAVETVVNAFDDETEVIYGTTEFVYGDKYICTVENGALEDLTYRMVIPHTAVFVKRDVYQSVGKFDLQYQLAADYDFILRMYLNGIMMKPIRDTLAYFRVGGATTKYIVLLAEEWRKVAMYYAEQRNDVDTIKKIEDYYQIRVNNAYAAKKVHLIKKKNMTQATEWIAKWLVDKGRLQIYGAGRCGIECFLFLEELGCIVEGFLDGNEKKQGTLFLGKPVSKCCEKESMNSDGKNYVIIAAMNYEEEIVKRLEELGYQKEKDFCLYSELVEKMYDEIVGEAEVR